MRIGYKNSPEFSPPHRRDLSDTAQARAGHGRALGAARRNDTKIGLILKHQGAGADYALLSDRNVVTKRRVDADEAALTHPDAPGNHDMRGDKDIVLNDGVVADMVAAPQRDVGSNLCKGLNGIVFEDEAVVLDLQSGKYSGPAAHIRHQQ